MKSIIHASITLGLLASPGLAQDEDDKKPAYRDAATHDKLVDKYRSAKKTMTSGENKKLTDKSDPTKKNQPSNIIESSDVIAFNGLTTLVPKGSILRLPKKFEKRVGVDSHKRTNRVVAWSEFFARNRGWITTIEVTRDQAHGESRIAEDRIEQLNKSPNMIVSTFSRGPISMIPNKETGAAPLSLPEEDSNQKPKQP